MSVDHVLVVGPPAFGRSALLASHFRDAVAAGAAGVWVDGSSVANEDHLLAAVAKQVRPGRPLLRCWREEWERLQGDLLAWVDNWPGRTALIAVDDLDDLVFKRGKLALLLAELVRSTPQVCLLGSSGMAGHRRLLREGEPLAGLLRTHILSRLSEARAHALLERRRLGLQEGTAEWVVSAAGGHPAALVYLGRIAAMAAPDTESELVESAATMAGAVYAGPWARLGPQQRAILAELSRGDVGPPVSAPELAEALSLQPSHLNAQLSRLVDEGLAWRPSRGQYSISRLLSAWIARRAVRGWSSPETDVHSRPPAVALVAGGHASPSAEAI